MGLKLRGSKRAIMSRNACTPLIRSARLKERAQSVKEDRIGVKDILKTKLNQDKMPGCGQISLKIPSQESNDAAVLDQQSSSSLTQHKSIKKKEIYPPDIQRELEEVVNIFNEQDSLSNQVSTVEETTVHNHVLSKNKENGPYVSLPTLPNRITISCPAELDKDSGISFKESLKVQKTQLKEQIITQFYQKMPIISPHSAEGKSENQLEKSKLKVNVPFRKPMPILQKDVNKSELKKQPPSNGTLLHSRGGRKVSRIKRQSCIQSGIVNIGQQKGHKYFNMLSKRNRLNMYKMNLERNPHSQRLTRSGGIDLNINHKSILHDDKFRKRKKKFQQQLPKKLLNSPDTSAINSKDHMNFQSCPGTSKGYNQISTSSDMSTLPIILRNSMMAQNSDSEKDDDDELADYTNARGKNVAKEMVDVIDGIEFVTFESEHDMVRFTRFTTEEPLCKTDGVDLGMSAEFPEAIIPKKTKDIKKIKGWRKKRFTVTQNPMDELSSQDMEYTDVNDGNADNIEFEHNYIRRLSVNNESCIACDDTLHNVIEATTNCMCEVQDASIEEGKLRNTINNVGTEEKISEWKPSAKSAFVRVSSWRTDSQSTSVEFVKNIPDEEYNSNKIVNESREHSIIQRQSSESYMNEFANNNLKSQMKKNIEEWERTKKGRYTVKVTKAVQVDISSKNEFKGHKKRKREEEESIKNSIHRWCPLFENNWGINHERALFAVSAVVDKLPPKQTSGLSLVNSMVAPARKRGRPPNHLRKPLTILNQRRSSRFVTQKHVLVRRTRASFNSSPPVSEAPLIYLVKPSTTYGKPSSPPSNKPSFNSNESHSPISSCSSFSPPSSTSFDKTSPLSSVETPAPSSSNLPSLYSVETAVPPNNPPPLSSVETWVPSSSNPSPPSSAKTPVPSSSNPPLPSSVETPVPSSSNLPSLSSVETVALHNNPRPLFSVETCVSFSSNISPLSSVETLISSSSNLDPSPVETPPSSSQVLQLSPLTKSQSPRLTIRSVFSSLRGRSKKSRRKLLTKMNWALRKSRQQKGSASCITSNENDEKESSADNVCFENENNFLTTNVIDAANKNESSPVRWEICHKKKFPIKGLSPELENEDLRVFLRPKPRVHVDLSVQEAINKDSSSSSIADINYSIDSNSSPPKNKEVEVFKSNSPKSPAAARKKLIRELSKLNANFVSVDENNRNRTKDKCAKEFCRLGCVCDSIRTNKRLTEHCGRIECMFSCLCPPKDGVSWPTIQLIGSDTVTRLQEESSRHMAKVEKAFHNTVVEAAGELVLPGRQQRERRLPKRFLDEAISPEALFIPKKQKSSIFYCKNIIENLSNVKKDVVKTYGQQQTKPCKIVLSKLDISNSSVRCLNHFKINCFCCKGGSAHSMSRNVAVKSTTPRKLTCLSKTENRPSLSINPDNSEEKQSFGKSNQNEFKVYNLQSQCASPEEFLDSDKSNHNFNIEKELIDTENVIHSATKEKESVDMDNSNNGSNIEKEPLDVDTANGRASVEKELLDTSNSNNYASPKKVYLTHCARTAGIDLWISQHYLDGPAVSSNTIKKLDKTSVENNSKNQNADDLVSQEESTPLFKIVDVKSLPPSSFDSTVNTFEERDYDQIDVQAKLYFPNYEKFYSWLNSDQTRCKDLEKMCSSTLCLLPMNSVKIMKWKDLDRLLKSHSAHMWIRQRLGSTARIFVTQKDIQPDSACVNFLDLEKEEELTAKVALILKSAKNDLSSVHGCCILICKGGYWEIAGNINLKGESKSEVEVESKKLFNEVNRLSKNSSFTKSVTPPTIASALKNLGSEISETPDTQLSNSSSRKPPVGDCNLNNLNSGLSSSPEMNIIPSDVPKLMCCPGMDILDPEQILLDIESSIPEILEGLSILPKNLDKTMETSRQPAKIIEANNIRKESVKTLKKMDEVNELSAPTKELTDLPRNAKESPKTATRICKLETHTQTTCGSNMNVQIVPGCLRERVSENTWEKVKLNDINVEIVRDVSVPQLKILNLPSPIPLADPFSKTAVLNNEKVADASPGKFIELRNLTQNIDSPKNVEPCVESTTIPVINTIKKKIVERILDSIKKVDKNVIQIKVTDLKNVTPNKAEPPKNIENNATNIKLTKKVTYSDKAETLSGPSSTPDIVTNVIQNAKDKNVDKVSEKKTSSLELPESSNNAESEAEPPAPPVLIIDLKKLRQGRAELAKKSNALVKLPVRVTNLKTLTQGLSDPKNNMEKVPDKIGSSSRVSKNRIDPVKEITILSEDAGVLSEQTVLPDKDAHLKNPNQEQANDAVSCETITVANVTTLSQKLMKSSKNTHVIPKPSTPPISPITKITSSDVTSKLSKATGEVNKLLSPKSQIQLEGSAGQLKNKDNVTETSTVPVSPTKSVSEHQVDLTANVEIVNKPSLTKNLVSIPKNPLNNIAVDMENSLEGTTNTSTVNDLKLSETPKKRVKSKDSVVQFCVSKSEGLVNQAGPKDTEIKLSVTTHSFAKRQSDNTSSPNTPFSDEMAVTPSSSSDADIYPPSSASSDVQIVREVQRNTSETDVIWYRLYLNNEFDRLTVVKTGFSTSSNRLFSAVMIARSSNRTVRLSFDKKTNSKECQQFKKGIYAVPTFQGTYVKIGPYKPNEPTGVKTYKKRGGHAFNLTPNLLRLEEPDSTSTDADIMLNFNNERLANERDSSEPNTCLAENESNKTGINVITSEEGNVGGEEKSSETAHVRANERDSSESNKCLTENKSNKTGINIVTSEEGNVGGEEKSNETPHVKCKLELSKTERQKSECPAAEGKISVEHNKENNASVEPCSFRTGKNAYKIVVIKEGNENACISKEDRRVEKSCSKARDNECVTVGKKTNKINVCDVRVESLCSGIQDKNDKPFSIAEDSAPNHLEVIGVGNIAGNITTNDDNEEGNSKTSNETECVSSIAPCCSREDDKINKSVGKGKKKILVDSYNREDKNDKSSVLYKKAANNPLFVDSKYQGVYQSDMLTEDDERNMLCVDEDSCGDDKTGCVSEDIIDVKVEINNLDIKEKENKILDQPFQNEMNGDSIRNETNSVCQGLHQSSSNEDNGDDFMIKIHDVQGNWSGFTDLPNCNPFEDEPTLLQQDSNEFITSVDKSFQNNIGYEKSKVRRTFEVQVSNNYTEEGREPSSVETDSSSFLPIEVIEQLRKKRLIGPFTPKPISNKRGRKTLPVSPSEDNKYLDVDERENNNLPKVLKTIFPKSSSSRNLEDVNIDSNIGHSITGYLIPDIPKLAPIPIKRGGSTPAEASLIIMEDPARPGINIKLANIECVNEYVDYVLRERIKFFPDEMSIKWTFVKVDNQSSTSGLISIQNLTKEMFITPKGVFEYGHFSSKAEAKDIGIDRLETFRLFELKRRREIEQAKFQLASLLVPHSKLQSITLDKTIKKALAEIKMVQKNTEVLSQINLVETRKKLHLDEKFEALLKAAEGFSSVTKIASMEETASVFNTTPIVIASIQSKPKNIPVNHSYRGRTIKRAGRGRGRRGLRGSRRSVTNEVTDSTKTQSLDGTSASSLNNERGKQPSSRGRPRKGKLLSRKGDLYPQSTISQPLMALPLVDGQLVPTSTLSSKTTPIVRQNQNITQSDKLSQKLVSASPDSVRRLISDISESSIETQSVPEATEANTCATNCANVSEKNTQGSFSLTDPKQVSAKENKSVNALLWKKSFSKVKLDKLAENALSVSSLRKSPEFKKCFPKKKIVSAIKQKTSVQSSSVPSVLPCWTSMTPSSSKPLKS